MLFPWPALKRYGESFEELRMMTSVEARMVHDAERGAWGVGRSAMLPCGVGLGRHETWRSPSCTRRQGASMLSSSWNR